MPPKKRRSEGKKKIKVTPRRSPRVSRSREVIPLATLINQVFDPVVKPRKSPSRTLEDAVPPEVELTPAERQTVDQGEKLWRRFFPPKIARWRARVDVEMQRQRGIRFVQAVSAISQAHQQAQEGPQKHGKMLMGWRDITRAIGTEGKKWRSLKTLNQRKKGPIRAYGPGQPPMVSEIDLLRWMEGLLEQATPEDAGGITDSAASLNPTKPYGRSGEVIPEEGRYDAYQVKHRRKDRGKRRKKR